MYRHSLGELTAAFLALGSLTCVMLVMSFGVGGSSPLV